MTRERCSKLNDAFMLGKERDLSINKERKIRRRGC